MDVLVVGAGPAGLTAACALSQQGVSVRVVDRADGPATTSRANILHARGVEVLDRLGVRDLDHESLTPLGMTMYAGGRPLATMRFAPDERESTQAQFISQAVIEGHLRQRLSDLGVEIEWGAEVTEFMAQSDSVTVRLESGESITTSWVVGCDGSRSVVREQAGIGFPGVAVVEQFLLADVVARWDRDRSTSAGFFHADGLLLAIPMQGVGTQDDTWRLMADVPGRAGEGRLSPEEIIDRLTLALSVRANSPDVEIKDVLWTSVFRIQRRLADTYRQGRVLIAGDAAHIHSPIGGQGMNTGIGDAENLAWKLAMIIQDRAEPSLLDTYTAERRPMAEDVLRNTTANTKILVADNPVFRLVRDRIFVPLLNSKAVQRQATRTASQLRISYRSGPLGSRRATRGVRVGDRVGDVVAVRTDGGSTRLHAELGRGWVLLLPSGVSEAVAARASDLLADRLGAVTVLATTGHTSTEDPARLIRPDGHLAWSGPVDSGEIIDAVSRVTGR